MSKDKRQKGVQRDSRAPWLISSKETRKLKKKASGKKGSKKKKKKGKS